VSSDLQQPTLGDTMPEETVCGDASVQVGAGRLSRVSWVTLALIAILLLGGTLRLTGLDWDEGQHLHPDERFLTMVENALTWPSSLGEYLDTAANPLNPYNKGQGSYVYGLLPLTLVKLVGQVTGFTGYSGVYLAGRAMSAVLDMLAVVVVFALGRRLYDIRVGLLGALLLALSVLNIQQSHFFTVDSATTFLVTLALYMSVRVAQGEGKWSLLGLGLAFGLALSAKISIATFAVIIGLALLIRVFARKGPSPGTGGERVEGAPAVRTGHIGRWKLTLLTDDGNPPERVRRLDASTLRWLRVALLMVFILFVAFWAFRLAQPQAFQGPGLFGLKLNQRWVDDMTYISKLMSGEIDYPPSHQWADRAPILYMLKNMVLWGLGIPLGLAVWFAWWLMGWQLIRKGMVAHLLPWFWMSMTFFYQSVQFVKTVRYLLPIYPTMALMAAYGLIWLWDRARRSGKRLPAGLSGAAIAVVVLGTAFWALAFTSIYTRSVTRIEASRWMYEHIPSGADVTFETWDDALPLNLDGKIADQVFSMVRMDPYWEDIPEKRTELYNWLAQADYIVLSSNRLYGSIPRLPSRYPMTTRYYEALFSGELGFEPIATFTSRPQLFGLEIVDDDADESFTVYDHPKVTVLRKQPDFSIDAVRSLFEGYDLDRIIRIRPSQVTGAPNGLMLTETEVRTQRQGGTWSEIFDRESLANRIPALVWWLCLTLLGWAAMPLAYPVLKSMPDEGYVLAKTLGPLLFGYLAWLLASVKVLPFGRGTLALVFAFLVLAGAAAAWAQRRQLSAFVCSRWRSLVLIEALFTVAFLAMLLVRFGNPDLWHASMGGEKPMDLAYLNAVIKSTTFPPYDPWFSGGYINYYYFGFVPIAALIKFTGIVPTSGYNLALASLFAMVAMGAAAVAAHLMPAGRDDSRRWLPHRWRWGLLAGLLVAVAGNLGEVELLWQGYAEAGRRLGMGALGVFGDVITGMAAVLTGRETLSFRPEWWYWNASRVMAHGEINEFPFFSFLYGDLHAHVMGMPLFVLGVGLASVLATGHNAERATDAGVPGHRMARVLTLLFLALTFGASWCANAWDLPTGLALAVAALVIRAHADGQPWSRLTMVSLVGQVLGLGLLSRLLYQPFHSRYGAAYMSVGLWKGDRSTLGDLALIYLPYLFVLITFLIAVGGRLVVRSPWWRSLRLGIASQRRSARAWRLRQTLVRCPTLLYPLVWLVIALGLILTIVLVTIGEPVSAVLAALLALAAVGLVAHGCCARERMVRLLVTAGLALCLGIEWVVLTGDIGRMNTVFKFSLQIWTLWGIASAVALHALLSVPQEVRAPVVRRGWWRTALVLLALGMAGYPILAAGAKVQDRIVADQAPGLDGMAFMDSARYTDNGQELTLAYDAAAIRWLQDNIVGSPVIVEANTPLYRWGGRISVYTGLPSVIGWDWHQKQQRAALSSTVVDWRLQDLNAIYTSESIPETMALLERYQVGLVYVGELERAYYPAEALAKFDMMLGDTLERVYEDGPVAIYRVLGSGARLVEPEPEASSPADQAGGWLARHWVPLRVAAEGPPVLAGTASEGATKDLMLDTPVEHLPAVSARGWNHAAARSVVLAVLCWWLVLLIVGLAAWPLVARVASAWPDYGFALARGVGLILVSYLAWLGASLRWVPNTVGTVWGSVALVAILALVSLRAVRSRAIVFTGSLWREVARGELIFGVAFVVFVVIRILNPDLWQPWFGGEKMMEIAMLNAVSKSAYLPPYDPYFAGGTLNYYYYGLYIVSLLGKLAGLSPEISFNLAVPTFFALAISHAFAVGRLVLGTGRLQIWQGACAAALVGLLGNLSGAWQYGEQMITAGCPEGASGLFRGIECIVDGLEVSGGAGAAPLVFDYWYASTRIIPYTINEFPFFTFLFADLHPHLIAMPFGLLALALLGLAIQPTRRGSGAWLLLEVMLALTVGALGVTNTWDLPIYLLLSVAVLGYVGQRRAGARGAVAGLGMALTVGLVAMLAYAPFYSGFAAQNLRVDLVSVEERTSIGPFLEIWGLFVWLLVGALGWQVRSLRTRRTGGWRTPVGVMMTGLRGVAGAGAVLATVVAARGSVGPVLVFLLVSAGAMCVSQWQHPQRWFMWLLITAALGLLVGIEWLYVADFLHDSDWHRMNTVFKFSLQVWVLLGVGLGAMLPVLWRSYRRRRGLYGRVWHVGLTVLLLAAFVYPVAALPQRVAERFPSGSPRRDTLDGTAYMRYAIYDAPGGSAPVDMQYDRQALAWIWEHIEGTPVLAEAPVGFYREGGLRISSYTGLPTLLGAHEFEQRPAEQVAPREIDAQILFTSQDPQVALGLLQRHDVRLVYIGPLERALYSTAALAKFETLVEQGALERIYANEQVALYRVTDKVLSGEESAS
jgi:YYY domain-containing protein